MTTFSEAFRACWVIAIFGIILLFAGFGFLFWNEGRAVHTILSLDEALSDIISLDVLEEQDQNYNGRIVHITGQLTIGEPLTEPEYNIQIQAVKLKRHVQMYQWVEETVEQNFGESVDVMQSDTRSYYYNREWREKLIDSRQFYMQHGHRNPERFPIESQTQIADAVYIGKYELGSEIKNKFNKFQEVTSDIRPDDPSIKMHLGLYYHSNDIFNPEVGDLRLLFTFAGMEGDLYTVVGMLQNNKLVPYKTSYGHSVLLVYTGEYTVADVFKQEHHQQRLTTWMYRFMGWVLVFFGVTCTSTLLRVLLCQVQFLAPLAPDPQFPIGNNFLLSFSFALIIASVAWVLHRPLIGAGLLFAAASPYVWFANSVVSNFHLHPQGRMEHVQ